MKIKLTFTRALWFMRMHVYFRVVYIFTINKVDYITFYLMSRYDGLVIKFSCALEIYLMYD
jgi:hypothetical protein